MANPATPQETNQAVAAAQVDPSKLTDRQRDVLGAVTKSSGAQGNAARKALGMKS